MTFYQLWFFSYNSMFVSVTFHYDTLSIVISVRYLYIWKCHIPEWHFTNRNYCERMLCLKVSLFRMTLYQLLFLCDIYMFESVTFHNDTLPIVFSVREVLVKCKRIDVLLWDIYVYLKSCVEIFLILWRPFWSCV